MAAAALLPGASQTTLRLVISRREPVAGSVYSASGPGRPFTGWSELAAAISAELETSGSLPDAERGDRA